MAAKNQPLDSPAPEQVEGRIRLGPGEYSYEPSPLKRFEEALRIAEYLAAKERGDVQTASD